MEQAGLDPVILYQSVFVSSLQSRSHSVVLTAQTRFIPQSASLPECTAKFAYLSKRT